MVFITISDDNNIITSLDMHEDTEMFTIMNIIENDFSLNMNINELTYNGKVVDKSDTLKKLNMHEGDLLFIRKKINLDMIQEELNANKFGNIMNNSGVTNTSATNVSTSNTGNILPSSLNNSGQGNNAAFNGILEQFRIFQEMEYIKKEAEKLLQLKTDKTKMSILQIQDKKLYDAINTENLEEIKKIVKERYEIEKKEKQREKEMYEKALKDPLSEESQKYIYEHIYKNQINSNLALAQEHFPEAFGLVYMLYIPVEINKNVIHAFVDSGAQTSIISKRCAEKCNILRLMDTRFTGIAKGVGTKSILGKIHMIDIKIGNYFYAVALTIIDDYDIDFIFGLDLLKRHQCSIDLKKNALVIEDNEIPFLAEKDIIKRSFENINLDTL
ncbi:DNA damage-inducible protein 1, putative [Plasmodium berghei]|uniref:DNA damage-inducible protein 1, putative n=2 Tax=Plasmodium berghei TaxID=5821 RepID=A0A509AN98_PLABA|nr:DNA damage-inducible protein 1, putative [Plasmodium berghei ANKA]CXI55809.1 DNA damage-inducible protein 1, putative [Plasmodium berghei]SCL95243.1 DNA damage-inducible protein 1, putative [Plasmodium berghei]SCM16207.1 DNA damage-inducible protein 1, putative [Plasmodium berghei]SCM18003.1 DNA damage-inducible protein 1, putative [Plasmodium berghei]SCN26412.1 DNA damage-inducible protein 1, putative [Plasmodium berghei]|eukprot:XP_034422131.1 DNA damage-inducible protein 1, putative [Plasmodium berghei ANKA]